ncbi:MAG: phytanoyl-CoA dioxygenase family protein [Meiothermus sp.]|nr:phytanoyl-CoA dioxygenase family protein [Meiothermus sp.]
MLEVLESNGFRLESRQIGALEANSPHEGRESLQRTYLRQGYLWLQNFLPREEVLAFRKHFFQAFQESGLVRGDALVGLYSGHEDQGLASKALMEQVRSAMYEAFCLHPRLVAFLDDFLGGPSYLHKRKLIRYTKPGDPSATGAHYDLVYLRGGTDKLVTVWIPIGDCPVEMGGLIYLEGSDAKGREMEADFSRKNADLSPSERISAYNKNMTASGWISKDLPALAEKFGSRWLAADYSAGDVVLHSPYMIHAATMNQDRQGRLRLSTDIRYQNVRHEIDARWGNHWTLEDML